MGVLEYMICRMLSTASAPVSASRLLVWTHVHIPTFPFDHEDFTDALTNLQSEGKVVVNENGLYHLRSEGDRALLELGL
jgi:hypothetical protein